MRRSFATISNESGNGARLSKAASAWSPDCPVGGGGLTYRTRSALQREVVYLDVDDPTEFRPPYVVAKTASSLSLGNVIAWLSDERAVVLRDRGLALIERGAQPLESSSGGR